MNLIGWVIFGTILVLDTIRAAPTRVYFSKCGISGFTCVTNANKKLDITYKCPVGVNDVVIFINQFSAPSNIERLKIQACKTLTLSTRCSNEARQIQKLEVINIEKLAFQRLQYEPMLPATVIFENISRIDTVPTKTFGQINKTYHSVGCYIQPIDFQNIHFRNVFIDTVQPNAFVGLNQFKNFSLVNVTIKTIQTSGIQLKQDFLAEFEIKNCTVEQVEHLGIQMYGKRSIFSDNHFTEISSSGINGTMEDFYFTKNFVETLQPHGFSVLATNIFILDNNFAHLKSSALEKLSPGLLQDSGMNFGRLKFVYDFSKNSLNYLDAGSLHPDYTSYENVQTEMMFSRNTFLCSCDNMGWFFSALGHGPLSAQLEPFYEMILDVGYGNTCDKPYGKACALPLKMINQMMECGKCLKNVTLDSLCDKLNGVRHSVSAVVTSSDVEETSFEDLSFPINYTIYASSGASFASTFINLCVVSMGLILI